MFALSFNGETQYGCGANSLPVELFPPEVELIDKGSPVQGPPNFVYSTNPFSAFGGDGQHYFVKGEDDVRIVLAETVAHTFASHLGIPVPEFAIGRFAQGSRVFASRVVTNCVRDVTPWLKRSQVNNLSILNAIVSFDAWIANTDRNLGNILGVPTEADEDKIDLIAIDFEKAACVRKDFPIIEIASIPPKSFWPTEELGRICKNCLKWSDSFLKSIQGLSDGQIDQVVKACITTIGCATVVKEESIQDILKRRRDSLHKIIPEVWN